jgi:hypothetical protein
VQDFFDQRDLIELPYVRVKVGGTNVTLAPGREKIQ